MILKKMLDFYLCCICAFSWWLHIPLCVRGGGPFFFLFIAASAFFFALNSSLCVAVTPYFTTSAKALYGKPKYPANFSHFAYTNPKAPKGGTLRLAALGSFDSFNPFVLKGTAAAGLEYLYDTLLARSQDEPLTKYPLVARKMQYAKDQSWVAFLINPKAHFNDGDPLTAADVVFSFHLLTQKSPQWRGLYAGVKTVKQTDKYRAVFYFTPHHSEDLALVLGQLPILPRHFWQHKGADFDSANFLIPVASGPYRIESYKAGKYIKYRRDKNYWARDLPVNRGRYNFDHIFFDYYRDSTTMIEGLRAGAYDWRMEVDMRRWPRAYEGPPLKTGGIILRSVKNHNPQTLSLVFNLRRPLFRKRVVRKALGLLFNFSVMNTIQYHGNLHEAASFFAGIPLRAHGLPDVQERQLLASAGFAPRHFIFAPIPAKQYPPFFPGDRLRQADALALLGQAGWQFKRGRLVDKRGRQMAIEIIVASRILESSLLHYMALLQHMGIKVQLKVLDSTQYFYRLYRFDFDVILHVFAHTPTPGVEQRYFWGSSFAKVAGSKNLSGLQSSVVDSLITRILKARSQQAWVLAVKVFDRLLTQNYFSFPLWYEPNWHIAYRRGLSHPRIDPLYGVLVDTWWWSLRGKKGGA